MVSPSMILKSQSRLRRKEAIRKRFGLIGSTVFDLLYLAQLQRMLYLDPRLGYYQFGHGDGDLASETDETRNVD
jgi:hypothetical protein